MVDILESQGEQQSSHLYIHFDVSTHFVSLTTFIETAKSAQQIVQSLDRTFFSGTLNYEIIVIPPESGTFLTKLGIWLCGGGAAVMAFSNSDIGAAYIKGLTGKLPSQWAQEVGEVSREYVADRVDVLTAADITEPPLPDAYTSDKTETDNLVCKIASSVIAAMTRGILEASPEVLAQVGMDMGELPEAMDARAAFYEACLAIAMLSASASHPMINSQFQEVHSPSEQ